MPEYPLGCQPHLFRCPSRCITQKGEHEALVSVGEGGCVVHQPTVAC